MITGDPINDSIILIFGLLFGKAWYQGRFKDKSTDKTNKENKWKKV